LANTVYNPRFEVELHWERIGQYPLEELKDLVCSLADKDDDILTQFIDRARIRKAVSACASFDELARVLRKMKIARD
jgi:hypothetical protein